VNRSGAASEGVLLSRRPSAGYVFYIKTISLCLITTTGDIRCWFSSTAVPWKVILLRWLHGAVHMCLKSNFLVWQLESKRPGIRLVRIKSPARALRTSRGRLYQASQALVHPKEERRISALRSTRLFKLLDLLRYFPGKVFGSEKSLLMS